MVAVFCFCWGPYASFAMINITGHGKVGDQNRCKDLQICPSITRTFPWYWPSCLFNFVKLSSYGTRSSLSSWTPWYNFPFFNSIESLHCIIWMILRQVHLQVDIADDAIFQLLKSVCSIFSWIPSPIPAVGLDIPLLMDGCLFHILSVWQMCLVQKANDNKKWTLVRDIHCKSCRAFNY